MCDLSSTRKGFFDMTDIPRATEGFVSERHGRRQVTVVQRGAALERGFNREGSLGSYLQSPDGSGSSFPKLAARLRRRTASDFARVRSKGPPTISNRPRSRRTAMGHPDKRNLRPRHSWPAGEGYHGDEDGSHQLRLLLVVLHLVILHLVIRHCVHLFLSFLFALLVRHLVVRHLVVRHLVIRHFVLRFRVVRHLVLRLELRWGDSS